MSIKDLLTQKEIDAILLNCNKEEETMKINTEIVIPIWVVYIPVVFAILFNFIAYLNELKWNKCISGEIVTINELKVTCKLEKRNGY